MKKIQMVDLLTQYEHIKEEVNAGIQEVINSTSFIKGNSVNEFEQKLGAYLNDSYIITCGNGTDALQIALMSLGLKPGDEVLVPAFTYIATVEVIALLGLVPVLVDVEENSFNIDCSLISKNITNKTKAIVPVHLYGQPANMNEIVALAKKHRLFVVEDTAQAIGAEITMGMENKKVSTIGDIGCLSFFPSKNLGCYGDGGALVTQNKELADKIRMIANHGQAKKYHHDTIGVNSRLDSIQAAVLLAKLPHLDSYSDARNAVAAKYDDAFSLVDELNIPYRTKHTKHVFHQYTLRVRSGKRDALKEFLFYNNIPSMIYYPIPIHQQKGYENMVRYSSLPVTERLSKEVLSLPIHTEMDNEQLDYIISKVREFFT